MWFDDTTILSSQQHESRLSRRRQSSTSSHFLKTGSFLDLLSPLNESSPYPAQPQKVFATIWRSQDRESPHVRQRARVCQDHVGLSHGLTTDPQLEDWHVICPAETGMSTISAKLQSSDTLCKRFAISTCHGRAWYLRCGQSELPDMTAWLIWQEYEPLTVPRQPSWILIDENDSYAGLSDTDTSICRHSLLTLFETRSTDEIRIALLTVYFVSNSFRRLSPSELTEAVQSTARFESGCKSQLEHNTSLWAADGHLLKICSPLFTSDTDGNVAFLEPSMKQFMSRVQLPGLEHGHGKMTQMCFAQIRQLGSMFIVRPWARFREWFRSRSDWPLFRYVARYWWCHYRLAAASRKDLTAELIDMINMALAGKNLGQTPILLQRRILNAGYSIAQVYDLPELKNVLQNMGASDTSLHSSVPPPQHWQHMRPIYGIRVPDQICFGRTATVSEVFDARSVLCIREDSAAAVTAKLGALHLQPRESLHVSPTDRHEASLPLLEYEYPHIHDWENIDIKELEQQTLSKFEDWEYVRAEDILDCV